MGELPEHCLTSPDGKETGALSVMSANTKKLRGKEHLGGKMNHDEIKMNKQMLSEISKLKRTMGEKYSSPGQSGKKGQDLE